MTSCNIKIDIFCQVPYQPPMKQLHVKKGKTFLEEGDQSTTAHILLSGQMEVLKDIGIE